MTYVVSDLNGHLDVYRDLLEKISFSEKRDVMYVLGDIVDYGPQPMELVQDLSTRIKRLPDCRRPRLHCRPPADCIRENAENRGETGGFCGGDGRLDPRRRAHHYGGVPPAGR